jgi:2-polyprenyl-3-methyl-5-hydroxy-6-metoxy-1,4-benzoquinol methylase
MEGGESGSSRGTNGSEEKREDMIANLKLPEKYAEWNQQHGAPNGHFIRRRRRLFSSAEKLDRLRGPFAIQSNNTTRVFAYPWAFEAGRLQPGLHVLEIGGGLGGFQFVLDQQQCHVTNVDPGMDTNGWPCNAASMDRLNYLFGTHVRLLNTTIAQASLPDASFDRVFCLSVIEHLSEGEARSSMQQAHRFLKPGGLLVMTADLFLNLKPFCSRPANQYGANQNLRNLIEDDRWILQTGDPACLYGFPEFNQDRILCNLENYLIGYYPTLVQCLVLQKR